MNAAEAMARALPLHEAGRLAEAEAIYQAVLRAEPEHQEALHLLGLVAHQSGRSDRAVELIASAIRAAPAKPMHLNNLGEACRVLGRLADAERHYRAALTMKEDYPEAHNNLGLVLRASGRLEESERACRRALALRPGYAEAHNNLANALFDLGRLEEAERAYRDVLVHAPAHAGALNNLGSLLLKMGRLEEAAQSYRAALAANPQYVDAYSNLAKVLIDLERPGESEAACRRALALKPDFPPALTNLGCALRELGRLKESEDSFRRALALSPEDPMVSINLGNTLRDLGRLEESVACLRRTLELKPDFLEARSNLIFTLDLIEECSVEQQQAERRNWDERYARRFAAAAAPHGNAPDPKRKLRVGYVSADFRRHSASYIFAPVMLRHDREAFEVYAYSAVKREDEVTARLRGACASWRSTLGMTDDALAAQIRADGIDILVDLSGHSAGNRLLVFARKPAPVQVTAWGHATGTGMRAMDYFLADAVLVPKAERALYAEEIVDLPCCVCYEPPEYLPDVSPLPAKPFAFGCINRIEKISDRILGLWGTILRRVPGSQLLVKDRGLNDPGLQRHFLERLALAGIEAARVRLLGHSLHRQHLEAYREVDVALDPYPHGGGVSTLEALWMGVPVVTLKGATPTSRLSASILAAAALPRWIAGDDEDYVKIAVAAARSLPALARTRAGMRRRLGVSLVGDAARYTRKVEAAYRAMWRRWCRGEARKA